MRTPAPIARGARLAGATAFALALTACNPFGTTTDPLEGRTDSASPTSEASPSPTVTASPSPSATASPSPSPSGALVNPPDGISVSPEIFLTAIDQEDGVLVILANVPGITENGGSCTVTARQGSTVIAKTNTGAANVNSTECGQYLFPLSAFSSGIVEVTVEYVSDRYAGESAPSQVDLS